ncbi:MAG TPA: lipid-A-disaccharide synthase, partial [Sutterella sp.]|nr:lipid-A-disaccharide synthase [Sutterella sp.]
MTNPSLVWLAGEASGDFIASLVMADIKRAYPEISMAGIGGPKMVASGLDAWYSSDLLSVRGYVEVLSKIPQLLWLRSTMARRVIREKPLAFIGVDAPDFNLGLELKLRSQSIKTIHLVCPAFWAWRANRIHTIAKAVDHMLCIFPFEKALLEKAHVPATYIGHPLASIIPEKPDKEAARARLGLNVEGPLFAVMPGSRQAEVKFCGPAFFKACEIVLGFD